MRLLVQLSLFFLATLSSATPAVAAQLEGEIDLRARVQVSGERVLLSDLGRLSGAAIEFGEIDLGHAPEAAATRRITGASILSRLRDAGLDEERIRYSIPAAVRVRRAHQEVDPEELRQAIYGRMLEWLAQGDEVESIELPPRFRVPLGDYAIRVSAPEVVSRHAHQAQIEIEQEGRVVARAPARLRIASRGFVVVARRPVPRGSLLTQDDVRTEERALRGLPPTLLVDSLEAVGRLARVPIAPGTVLTARHVEVPVMVEKGDLVRVGIDTNGMRLTVPAEALDSAGLGERVRLLNRSSGREFVAEVIAHGRALVHY